MFEKKHCYRYVDTHDSKGRAVIELYKCVILRETEKTFWYCHDFPYRSIDEMRKYMTNKDIKRCLKGAARSRYHLTKEEALSAFVYRKVFQFERIKLTAEKVSLCLKALSESGHLEGFKMEGERIVGFSRKVVSVPDGTIVGEKGPEAENYSWGEY